MQVRWLLFLFLFWKCLCSYQFVNQRLVTWDGVQKMEAICPGTKVCKKIATENQYQLLRWLWWSSFWCRVRHKNTRLWASLHRLVLSNFTGMIQQIPYSIVAYIDKKMDRYTTRSHQIWLHRRFQTQSEMFFWRLKWKSWVPVRKFSKQLDCRFGDFQCCNNPFLFKYTQCTLKLLFRSDKKE